MDWQVSSKIRVLLERLDKIILPQERLEQQEGLCGEGEGSGGGDKVTGISPDDNNKVRDFFPF